jgi:hypothetical protein
VTGKVEDESVNDPRTREMSEYHLWVREPLSRRLMEALAGRHRLHEDQWGAFVRDCQHPSCFLDVEALKPEFDAMDRQVQSAVEAL